jgi:hypothetical protein
MNEIVTLINGFEIDTRSKFHAWIDQSASHREHKITDFHLSPPTGYREEK